MIFRKTLLALSLTVMAIATATEAAELQQQHILSGKITIEGSGDSQQLLRALARRFEDLNPGTEVEVPDGIGNSGGIEAIVGNRVQLARLSRPLNELEKSHGLIYRVFAKSPVVFASLPGNRLSGLNSEQIVRIYSGEFVNWKQLGASASKIYPVGRESTDPARIALNEHIPGFRDIKSPISKTYYTASGLVEALSRHEGAIGYASIAMVKKADLKILKVDEVYPLTMNVKNGTYKIVIPFAIVHRGNAGPLALAFVDFLYSREAHKIIMQYGCVPVE